MRVLKGCSVIDPSKAVLIALSDIFCVICRVELMHLTCSPLQATNIYIHLMSLLSIQLVCLLFCVLVYAAWVLVRLSCLFYCKIETPFLQRGVMSSVPVRDCKKYMEQMCSSTYFLMCHAFVKEHLHNLFLVGLKDLVDQRIDQNKRWIKRKLFFMCLN